MDFDKEDKIITIFLRSLGPWSSYIVIGGGYAPIIYKLYFSDSRTGNPPVGTRDIDSLVPRKIPEISKKNNADFLENAGFQHQFKDRNNPATESFTKVIEGVELEIEFLTDDATRRNKAKNVKISGVTAQPLSYLKLSIQKSIPFTTSTGREGFVVSPEAWMFHKGLTCNKRTSKVKAYKDLYGIWYVGTQLGEWSNQSLENLRMLLLEYPSWYRSFKKNLLDWTMNATPLDWSTLEDQDPYGKLKKGNFLLLIERVLR